MNTMYKPLGKQTLQILFCKSQEVRLMSQIVTLYLRPKLFFFKKKKAASTHILTRNTEGPDFSTGC